MRDKRSFSCLYSLNDFRHATGNVGSLQFVFIGIELWHIVRCGMVVQGRPALGIFVVPFLEVVFV